jgi:hypothetical protein
MGKNQDPGSGINIPDPQHWLKNFKMSTFTVLVEEPADDSCSVVDPFVLNPKKGDVLEFFLFMHTIHSVGGCWDRTQDCCDSGYDSLKLDPLG